MTFSPGTLLGRYELIELIRDGGLSEVYRARDVSLGRDVAVKVLPRSLAEDPVSVRRFEQESRAAGQLEHPGILTVHDVGIHDGRPYLVAEWLEGETLREHLAGHELSWPVAVAYAIRILEGIAAAHERGIVHRDLKPENLFLVRGGRVKILDFGLARLLPPPADVATRESPTAATATESGVILGTVGYMSPEQVRGQPADTRSDIFAFGAILYEMVAGRRAFQADSAIETMVAILREEPPPIARAADASGTLDRIIRRCLEKEPEGRFQSARDLAHALQDLLADAPDRARPPTAGAFAGRSGASETGPSEVRRERPRSAAKLPEETGFRLILTNREVSLSEGETILGRARDATVRLHDRSVSRHHARVTLRRGIATVENLRSKNGTFVGGRRIESSTRLADGDEIRLGSLSMVFRTSASTGSTDTESGT